MATAIDDLAIVLSASTDRLAGDLRTAARMVESFGRTVARASGDLGAVRDAAKGYAGIATAARAAGAVAAAPFKAMAAAARGLDALIANPMDTLRSVWSRTTMDLRAGLGLIRRGFGALKADGYALWSKFPTRSAIVSTLVNPLKLAGVAADGLAGLVRLPFRAVAGLAVRAGRAAPPDGTPAGDRVPAGAADRVPTDRTTRRAVADKSERRSSPGIMDALATPFRAMTNGGLGAALSDPFVLATTAVDTFAAVVETPFKLIASGAKLAADVITIPFKLASAAADGLGSVLGGLGGVLGGLFGGIAKFAGGIIGTVGNVIGGLVSSIGSLVGAVGETFGKILGGAGRAAVQVLAASFGPLKEAVNLASELEQTRIAFDVLTGSAQKAGQVIAGLRKFAAETPFSNKDVTGAAKSLAGYGVAADQLVPTVKMLGEVSAAVGKPLAELTYLYGTLLNQDRAYIVDIKQFATAGIPIYAELAKVLGVTEDRTREMVEAGKVGIPEVQKAFKNLTGEGGRFNGLMARQADSVAGAFEQLSDAFQMAKAKLGGILIEELGLKKAAADAQGFIKTIEGGIDRIRPAVRFVGELARAAANVAREFGAAAMKVGEFGGGMISDAFPSLRKIVDDVARAVKDAQQITIDPANVAGVIFDVGRAAMNVLANLLDGLNSVGVSLVENFVKPLQRGADSILRAYVDVKHFVGTASPAERFSPPKAFERDEDIVARYRELQTEIAKAAQDYQARLKLPDSAIFSQGKLDALQRVSELRKLQRDFLSKDIFLEGRDNATEELRQAGLNHLLAIKGRVPVMADRQPFVIGDEGGALKNAANWAREQAGHLDKLQADMNARFDAQKAVARAERDAAAAAEQARNAFGALAGGAALASRSLEKIAEFEIRRDPSAAVMEAAKKAREEFGVPPAEKLAKESSALQESAIYGLFGMKGGTDLGTFIRAMHDLTGRAQQLAGAEKVADPDRIKFEIDTQRSTIDTLVKAGLLSPKAGAAGLRDFANKKAEELGIEQQPRLPDAAMKDTTESVRILNEWASGFSRQSTESLLRMILDYARYQYDRLGEIKEKIEPAPPPRPIGP